MHLNKSRVWTIPDSGYFFTYILDLHNLQNTNMLHLSHPLSESITEKPAKYVSEALHTAFENLNVDTKKTTPTKEDVKAKETCHICGKSKSGLSRHIKSIPLPTGLKCPLCDKYCKNQSGLRRHQAQRWNALTTLDTNIFPSNNDVNPRESNKYLFCALKVLVFPVFSVFSQTGGIQFNAPISYMVVFSVFSVFKQTEHHWHPCKPLFSLFSLFSHKLGERGGGIQVNPHDIPFIKSIL